MEFRNDNFNLNKKGVSLKFTGRSINDINVNNSNGIGIQLINNQVNNREFAFIDTYNVDNDFYSKLKIGFNNSTINIRNLNEINQIQSLNFNNSLTITNYVGIGSTTPKSLLDVAGRISCYDINIGGIILNKDYLLNISGSVDNITSGILKIANGGTGASSFKSDQLLFGNFQQSPNLVWKEEKRRLGIGLTDPLYNIDVNGGINAFSYKILGNDINNIFIKPNDLLLSSNEVYNNCYNTSIISCKNYADNVSADLIYRFNQTVSDWTSYGPEIVYVNTRVGIGTNSPLTSLDVVGDINFTGNLRNNGSIFKNFSGDYNDLTNTPLKTWALSNGLLYNLNTTNVGIGTSNPLSKLDVNGDINFSGSLRKNGNIINFFSGDYNDLTNRPNFSKIAYSGSYYDITEAPMIFSGSYNDLINVPSFFPTNWSCNVSNLPAYFPADWGTTVKNKPKYFKTDWNTTVDNIPLTFNTNWNSNIINKPTYFPTDWETTIFNKPDTFNCDWNSNILNKPTFADVAFTGKYSDIRNKPFIFSGLYRELRGKPNFATVTYTGNYFDLNNLPKLFTGDYSTLSNIPRYFQTDWNTTITNIPTFSKVATTGNYYDLINCPIDNWSENGDHIFNCNIGNVGIGTSNPNYKLDIRGTFNIDGVFKIDGVKGALLKNSPWGAYFAEDYVVGSNILPDSSGNGRHATTSANITKTTASGNGAIGAITYISGGTTAKITWPDGSIPTGFTILSLTRYNGTSKNQILKDKNSYSYYGHEYQKRGVFRYMNNIMTRSTNVGIIDNWLCSTFKTYGTWPNNIIIDGSGIANIQGFALDPGQLFINNDTNVASDWAFGCVIIWDKILSDADMLELNTILQNNLRDGGSTKSLFIDNNYKISFNADTYFNCNIYVNNSNISNIYVNKNDFIRTSNWVIDTNNIYNVNTGSVGIGTTNPSSSYKLDVNGIINSIGYNISSVNGGIRWSAYGDTGINCANANGDFSPLALNGDMVIKTQDANRLILQNGTMFVYNNRIGIGINDPSSLLHLHASSGDIQLSLTDGSTGIGTTDGFAIIKTSTGEGKIWNYENSPLRFGTNNSEKMCILTSGNVGIGTINPSSLLQLHNTSATSTEIKILLTDGSTGALSNNGFAIYKSSTNDGNIWNYMNNALRFGTNNAERMCISSNGNVGIGTDNPNSLLHLNNTANTEIKISLTDATTGFQATDGFAILKTSTGEGRIWNYENFPLRFGTSNSEKMCILETGNIGIGTNNPTSLLQLYNTGTSEIKISLTDASTGFQANDGFSIYKSSANDGYIWNYENNALRFGTNNAERMCISSNGNIGVGTNNPNSLLHLNTTSGDIQLSLTDATSGFQATDGFAIIKTSTGEGKIWNYENSPLRFGTSNSEKMCILETGNIGIGTINPTSILQLYNTGTSEIKILLTDGSTGALSNNGFAIYKSTTNDGYIWNYTNNTLRFGTNNAERMCILANGNVGINSLSPQNALDVVGTIKATNFSGDGSLLTNLSIANISSGIVPVNRGGIGTNNLATQQILIGNTTNAITQSPLLIWDSSKNNLGIGTTITCNLYKLHVNGNIYGNYLYGDGTNITNLNANNITSSVLPVSRGGIGTTTLANGQILIGNGTSILQTSNLFWDNANNKLGINNNNPQCNLDVSGTIRGTTIYGDGANITNLNANNITTGILPISRGGIGTTTLETKQILVGNGTSILQTPNLIWDITSNRLGIGSTIPQSTLDITGNVNINGDTLILSNNSVTNTIFYIQNTSTLASATTNLWLQNNIGYASGINIYSGNNITTTPYTKRSAMEIINNYGDILISAGSVENTQGKSFIHMNSRTSKIGINKYNAGYTLDINGDINFTGNIYLNDRIYNTSTTSSQWTSTSTSIWYMSGNVGIGSSRPNYTLDVTGVIKCNKLIIGSTYITDNLLVLNNTNNIVYSKISFINYTTVSSSTFNADISCNGNLMLFTINAESLDINNGFLFTGNCPFVGIGTDPERGLPLKVSAGTKNINITAYYITTNTNIQNSTSTWNNISAYFDSHILINGDVIITSDSRIKKDINNINSYFALNLISKIKPKSFKFIDFIEKGTDNNYGFIAQDVKELIPEAVGLRKEYIPNIMKIFNCNDDIIETNEDLNLDDNIQIIDKENKKQNYKIIEKTSNYIKVDKKIEDDKCFIYGKEVEDFHILDKNLIYTLNVSATQELNKRIEELDRIIKEKEIKVKELEELILAKK